MDKQLFGEHFRQAHDKAFSYACEMVIQRLPDAQIFLLYPNQSYDGNPLVDDEEIYPEESLSGEEHLPPLTASEAVDWLWRNGKVPEWVDVSVESCNKSFTFIRLLCCGRYTAKIENLYHQREQHQPFHVTSPGLPPGWESVEKSGRFDVNWRDKPKWRNKWSGIIMRK